MLKHLFGNKVDDAIERLRGYEELTKGEGFYLAFSGGKDSCVIKALADMAGVKYDAHYNVTTIDPPELTYFVREHHKDVLWNYPADAFLKKLTTKGFPIRQGRWCCEYLKESHGSGRMILTGIRWAESARRSKRRMVEACYHDPGKRYLHPIIDWTEGDVWEFIRVNEIPYCKLYDEGAKRIGCLFCPMAKVEEKLESLKKHPRFAAAFVRAFQKLKENREAAGKTSCDRWADGQEMFDWWIRNESSSPTPDGGLFT